MEASQPKSVNPVLNIIGVNTLWLGGLHIIFAKSLNDKYFTLKLNILIPGIDNQNFFRFLI